MHALLEEDIRQTFKPYPSYAMDEKNILPVMSTEVEVSKVDKTTVVVPPCGRQILILASIGKGFS